MCGIVGYAGGRQAVPILLDGLKKLEYRGYDSAGVAVVSGGKISLTRSVGKLANLDALLARNPLPGFLGLGHTRWATHGGPSELNAHPHTDCDGSVALIHNGIIENHAEIKAALRAAGHVFKSATDTEVLSHLIEDELKRLEPASSRESDFTRAVREALKKVRGTYALAVVWSQAPGAIIAAKRGSPLVVGLGDGENFMASDVPAILKHTRSVVYLEDEELVVLTGQGCVFQDRLGRPIDKPSTLIEWDDASAEKSGYDHFMLKEIHEQPRAVENTLRGRLLPLNGGLLESETGMSADYVRSLAGAHIVACGTSWHAGIIGKYLLERHAGLAAQIETASEFRYRKPVLAPGTLVIALSQSGETADTLAAVRLAREAGLKVLAISNTVGSAIARHADFNLHTRCGPECGVASTKAFLGQLGALSLLTMHAAALRGALPESRALEWAAQLLTLPDLLRQTLELNPRIRDIAAIFARHQHFLFIGRGVNYPTALEGALKLKEISYIHAEGFPAGEMKHGPLALIDSEMPVVAIATESEMLEKTLSNIEEARARGARVIALVTRGERRLDGKAEHVLELPPVGEHLSPALNAIPLQLLAYHIADLRGCDVDQPRNLAKSVTVE
jgi:glucosamine--fructose-6-phosphate aminotransferase (isomerizing)